MIYVRIEEGKVQEVLYPILRDDGTEYPIEERFPSWFVDLCVDVTAYDPQPSDNWLAVNTDGVWTFTAPQIATIPMGELAENKRTELRNHCFEEITRSSFQSAALGSVHNYDCRIVDQLNLKVRLDIATALSSTEPLWASDGTRYQWKLHTAQEIMDVMIDMNNHVKTSQVKLASKLASVDAASTRPQIDAILW